MAVKCTGKGSWSLISAKARGSHDPQHFESTPSLTLCPQARIPWKPAKGPFRGSSWEINLLRDPKEDCSERRKSEGPEKSSFQRMTGKNWDPRQHMRYELQQVKRHFPAQIKYLSQEGNRPKCQLDFDLVAGLQVGCFML